MRFVGMLVLDVGLPLVLYYALRGFGASQWTALIVGAGIPVLRVAVVGAVGRRLE